MLKHAIPSAWIAFAVSVGAVVCAAPHRRFPAILLSSFLFAAVLTWCPRCRPSIQPALCPWNWALLMFCGQLVGLPLLIAIDGPSAGVLPFLPSAAAINLAILLNCAAFLACCAAYSHCRKFSRASSIQSGDVISAGREEVPRSRGGAALLAALLGLAGVFLSFRTLAGIFDYFSDPTLYRDYFAESSATWSGLAALFLKPFLGFAAVMLWCLWMDGGFRHASPFRRSVFTIGAFTWVIAAFGLVGYNRGAFVAPLLAMTAVVLARGDRMTRVLTVSAGVVVLALMPAYALYRGGTELAPDLGASAEVADVVADSVDISDMVQMYAGAPQYLGFLLERGLWGAEPRWGMLTTSSLLAPVPVIGKIFRPQSGFAVYNRMVYETDAIADQNASFAGETFLDFHIPGVLAGFGLLGWALHRLQNAFERASSSLELYIWQFGAW